MLVPALPLSPETGLMRNKPAARSAVTWRRGTIWLPGMLAFAASGLLIVADGLAGVMGSWDTPAPGLRWIKVGVIGHCILAAASVVVLGAGLRCPSWRRAASITAWMIVPIGFAWFLLTGRLASRS
jgi:hypothetical protein